MPIPPQQERGRMPESPDAPLILCYDGSEGAKHGIQRAGDLLAPRPALVLTVWEPVLAVGPGLGGMAGTVNFAELDRALAEDGGRIAEEGPELRVTPACRPSRSPSKPRDPSGIRSSRRPTPMTRPPSSWARAVSRSSVPCCSAASLAVSFTTPSAPRWWFTALTTTRRWAVRRPRRLTRSRPAMPNEGVPDHAVLLMRRTRCR